MAKVESVTTYKCNDGNAEIEIEADSAEEAAQEYVDGGDWGEIGSTTWINVHVEWVDENGDECDDWYKIELQPEEPECSEGEHDWESPYEILGGCKENPGVRGHGGGVISHEVCMHCGCERVTDTWAQDMTDGKQGLRSVSYEPGKYTEEIAEYKESVED